MVNMLAETFLEESLRNLSEKLGLDVTPDHQDKRKINIQIQRGDEQETTKLTFISNDNSRAQAAAANFGLLLNFLGCGDIRPTLHGQVTFAHPDYMPLLNMKLADLLDKLSRTGDKCTHNIEDQRLIYALPIEPLTRTELLEIDYGNLVSRKSPSFLIR